MLKNLELILQKNKNLLNMSAAAVSVALSTAVNSVFALDGASTLMVTALDTLGKIAIVPAVFLLISGILHYAEAKSDGDGPAQKKAVGMMAAGVMVAVVAGFLIATSTKNEFLSLMPSTTDI